MSCLVRHASDALEAINIFEGRDSSDHHKLKSLTITPVGRRRRSSQMTESRESVGQDSRDERSERLEGQGS